MPEYPTTWNLTPLFSHDDDEAIAKDLAAAREACSTFASTWRNRVEEFTTPSTLRKALEEYEELYRLHGTSGKAGYYFSLRTAQDAANPTLKAKDGKVTEEEIALSNEIQFFELSLGKLSVEVQNVLLKAEELVDFHHFLERAFANSAHMLSEPEERIMKLKSQGAKGNWVQMLSGLLAKEVRSIAGEDGAVTDRNLAEIGGLMSSRTKSVRGAAAAATHEVCAKWVDVAEAELNAVLLDRKVNDELRGYTRPDASRHLSDDIDSPTVDAMLEAVRSQVHISQRFYSLKAKLLGVDTLAYHERNVPYGSLVTEYTYLDALALVEKVLGNLDPHFAEIIQRFAANGQFDVFPRAGKRGGAFCAGGLHSQPTYILLNHTNRLEDVLTLAHELGHGINNELLRENQRPLYYGTPLSTAEVASTFMEDYVLEELLKEATEEERLAILMIKLNDDVSTIFRQAALYGFEQEIHATFRQQGYMSHQQLGMVFRKHMSSYMGDAVTQDEGSQNWWVQWPHIRSCFYVYSYASGLLISKALQAMVHADPSSMSKVNTFLSTGMAKSPAETFAEMDIDITSPSFWVKGVAQCEALLNQTEALAKTLGKI